MAKAKKRVLSGIQPTGSLHLGNYFGALKQQVAMQAEYDCFYFIANYHALTTIKDAAELEANTREVAVSYLAFGLDPEKATFFRQSDVPEGAELTWILSTVTGVGLLQRAHSYKDKVARGLEATAGLFFYPVLMASDILIYKSNLVPVGEDQVQHVEMTRDMAGYFNRAHREVFPLPEAKLDVAPKVPGTDGQKMSKSYGNTIDIFAEGKALKKAVMGIVTDSTPVEAPKEPGKCSVFALWSLFASESEKKDLAAKYRAGGLGYGEVKKMLLEKIEKQFAPAREKRAKLLADPGEIGRILTSGGERARAVAAETMREVRAAAGV